MATANQVADFILGKIDAEAGDSITHLKIQKLVYYCQAWSLALDDEPIFAEQVEAWLHGPVVRSVWNRFREYDSRAILPCIRKASSDEALRKRDKEIIDEVWEAYGHLSGSQLRYLTHAEEPWKKTREGIPSDAGSNRVIKRELMRDFYRARLAQ